jgi:hypothetical protein
MEVIESASHHSDALGHQLRNRRDLGMGDVVLQAMRAAHDDQLPTPPAVRAQTRVRVEITGSQKCGIVGKSRSFLITINPMIFTRTHPRVRTLGTQLSVWVGTADMMAAPCADACPGGHELGCGRRRAGRLPRWAQEPSGTASVTKVCGSKVWIG